MPPTPRPRRRALVCAAALTAPLFAAAAFTVPAQAAPVTAVVGAQTSGDSLFPGQGNGGYDVTHYDVDLTYAAAGSITATARIDAVTTDAALSSYSLDLEGLTVSSVSVDGEPAAFARVADASGTTIHKLVVTPASPVEDAFETVVTYSGTPVQHTDPDGTKEGWTATPKGAVALGRIAGTMTWLPCNNTPADKATFTTRLRIPTSGLATAAVSNGRLASKTTGAGLTTWTWEQGDEQAPQAALIAIGAYTQLTGNVSVDFGSRSVPQWSYLSASAAVDSVTTATRGRLADVLESIESYYGSYPGSSVGMVVDDTSLGYTVGTQDRPYLERTAPLGSLIRGYARQWFGTAVAPSEWKDAWLGEGLAAFVTTQVGHELTPSLPDTAETYYKAWSQTPADSPIWSVAPAAPSDPAQVLGPRIRDRAAMTMEALRLTLGDAFFHEVVGTWAESYAGSSVTTAEFVEFVESSTGRDLGSFFQDWLYDTDKPRWPSSYDLTLVSDPADGSTVEPTDRRTYTLRATNTGRAPMSSATVDVDLRQAHATTGTLPAGLTVDPTDELTLHWKVPTTAVGATASATFTLTGLSTQVRRESEVRIAPVGIGGECVECTSMVVVVPAKPVVSGDARVGSTLTAAFEGFGPAQEFRYQWLRDGDTSVGTDAATYVVQPGDVGHTLRVRVTAIKTDTPSVTRTSDATATVLGRAQTATPTPVVSGVARVGRVLTARPGSWDSGTTVAYRWSRNGTAVPGATRVTYRLVPGDLGKRLTVEVTGSRAGFGSATRTSLPTRAVALGAQTLRTKPVLRGRAQVGRILRAVPGRYDPGARLAFRWVSGGRTIAGATRRTLRLSAAYAGKRVVVLVTATRAGYAPVTTRSAPTVKVKV